MNADTTAAGRYFDAIGRALEGLHTFLREDDSPLYRHDVIGAVIEEYLARLAGSFESWKNHIAFAERFRVSQAESGFPVFQNVMEMENDAREAKTRLASLPDGDKIRQDMVDFILKRKQFPLALQKTMAERSYLESVEQREHFSPYILPRTVRVSVNPKTGRPYYVVHWGHYDGIANLPLVYMAVLEDSSKDIVATLVDSRGRLNRDVEIPLPVDGLLNPALANAFDAFCEKNSSYSLTLATIAANLDRDFPALHPKQLRRFILGPFYHADITRNGENVDQILQKVHRPENAWLMTWTLQELYSTKERPAKWGLLGGEPPRDEFFINTDDLECARQGVSAFKRNALVPHEAYQAIYAAGEAEKIFDGYETHILSGERVLRRV